MFEAVNNMTLNTQGSGNVTPSRPVPLQPAEKTLDKESAPNNLFAMEHAKRAEQQSVGDKQTDGKSQVTEQMLKELEQDIEAIHNVGLKFSKHDDTGRTIVKILNKENDEVIREIPCEDVLNLAAKIEEMIGILFDKEV